MIEKQSHFALPPQRFNQQGDYRQVGFELEFTGLSISQAAETLQQVYGGTIEEISVAEAVLQVAEVGEFKIELDWGYLKVQAAAEGKEPSQWLELLSQSAMMLVPIEVVCPPIPLNQLDQVEPLVPALRKAGAVGTKDTMLAAYGVHINTEIPHHETTCLLNYLRAFSLLQWWLVENEQINYTRRLTPYIDLYPEAYLRSLFSAGEKTIDELCTEYLQHNASRNRALDLLPILAEFDQQRVDDVVGDDKIKARPAFHYRLPDCHIEQPDWSLAKAWSSWLLIERLAEEPSVLESLAEEFLARDRPLLGVSRSDWIEVMDRWVNDQLLA